MDRDPCVSVPRRGSKFKPCPPGATYHLQQHTLWSIQVSHPLYLREIYTARPPIGLNPDTSLRARALRNSCCARTCVHGGDSDRLGFETVEY